MRVLADPRFDLPAESRQAKLDALMRAGALQETLTAAIDRLGRTRQDVETILARREKEREEREDAAGATSDEPDELARQGRELLAALDEQVGGLWTPPDTQGIPAGTTPWDDVGQAQWMLGGDWSAPTAAQLRYLEIAEDSTRKAVEEINRFYAEEVAPFRAAAQDDHLRLLAEPEPLAMP